jgi:hypothetical protein
MQASFNSPDNPLIRKLDSIFTLTDDERKAVDGALAFQIQQNGDPE